MFDLNDVALFVRVVRDGSFAEAARQLGQPPNTVSRRVQELEDQLGTRLLQRSTRKLTLTQAGQAFYGRCEGAVDGLLEAGNAVLRGSEAPSGLLRVAAPADFFDFFPMAWVAAFLEAHPRVRIEFVLSDERADLIAERIDVAFRGGPMQDVGYVGRELQRAAGRALYASPGYLKARGAPASVARLVDFDCLTFAHPSGKANWRLDSPDGGYEEVQLTPRLSANTAQALRRACVAGLGIALLPGALAAPDVAGGLLMPVLPAYQRKGHGLYVLYSSRRHLPLAVSAFIDAVSARIAEHDAAGTLPWRHGA